MDLVLNINKLQLPNRAKLLTFLFILATVFEGNLCAQKKLFIESGKENYPLGRYLSILEDKENKLSINEASSDSMRNKYVYHYKETQNLRFTSSAYWLRLIVIDTLTNSALGLVNNQNIGSWIIVNNEPVIEDIRFFYRDLTVDGNKYKNIKAGSAIPVNQKIIKSNDFIAKFPIQKNVPDTVYLRVQTNSQFIISFNVLTTGDYVIRNSKKYLFHGLLFGIFFLLIAYNTLLYFSIKEKTYILYVLYISCYTFFIFTYEGYYFEIIGRTFNHDYFLLPMGSLSLAGVFWLLLTREFLSTKMCLPWAYKLLTYITPLVPIIFICAFSFVIPWLAAVWAVCLLSYYVLGLIISFITLKKGIDISKYYILAVSGMALGIITISTTRNGFLPMPYNFWTQNGVNFGILWEALVLAATVGYRFSHLKAEKEIEKTLIRNQIAADLHDEIGSNLSTISLQSRMMIKARNWDIDSKERLENIANIANITTDTIRDIVWFINPFHDKSEELFIRMKELASKMLINLNYTFTSSRSDERIFDFLPDLNKRRHVYLTFKEVLNNIIKHSAANKTNISFSAENKKFIMMIEDNGKGFKENEIKHGDGLKNLRNRAVMVGAQIFIESKVGKGTKIILEVPI